MSYRTIKKMLGETSLERKFRFLFGGGLLLLIAGSFWVADQLNESLADGQMRRHARMLVPVVLVQRHYEHSESKPEIVARFDELSDEMMTELEADFDWKIYKPDPTTAEPGERPDEAGYRALERLRGGVDDHEVPEEDGHYVYYAALRARTSCIECHKYAHQFSPADPATGRLQESRPLEPGDLLGMARISLPLEETRASLNLNSAYLWTTAIVIAFLAMAAAYGIVRYIIVKPVLHLKNVSDDIAHGVLDRRADIRTGDEFEELSHAFNRMLRHLTTVQDELRQVNTDLDAKVDELAHVNLTLFELNKIKDEFLATMSHELRTPLNSILGFSDLLANSENLTDKQKRFLNNIQTAGNNLMGLINDLLDLAKIESGKMEIHAVEFSITDLVERQVAALSPLAEKKNIELSYDIDPALMLLMQDPVKMRQILNNLLSNAVKFTPEGGRVRVQARRFDNTMFDLVVEDTGLGIPLEEQEAIFDKFRQGRSVPGQKDTMTREYGGTGLGLSIVKELAKLLGGEVLLESEFGKGSTFTVRLPYKVPEQPNLVETLQARIAAMEDESGNRSPDEPPVRAAARENTAERQPESDESAA